MRLLAALEWETGQGRVGGGQRQGQQHGAALLKCCDDGGGRGVGQPARPTV